MSRGFAAGHGVCVTPINITCDQCGVRGERDGATTVGAWPAARRQGGEAPRGPARGADRSARRRRGPRRRRRSPAVVRPRRGNHRRSDRSGPRAAPSAGHCAARGPCSPVGSAGWPERSDGPANSIRNTAGTAWPSASSPWPWSPPSAWSGKARAPSVRALPSAREASSAPPPWPSRWPC